MIFADSFDEAQNQPVLFGYYQVYWNGAIPGARDPETNFAETKDHTNLVSVYMPAGQLAAAFARLCPTHKVVLDIRTGYSLAAVQQYQDCIAWVDGPDEPDSRGIALNNPEHDKYESFHLLYPDIPILCNFAARAEQADRYLPPKAQIAFYCGILSFTPRYDSPFLGPVTSLVERAREIDLDMVMIHSAWPGRDGNKSGWAQDKMRSAKAHAAHQWVMQTNADKSSPQVIGEYVFLWDNPAGEDATVGARSQFHTVKALIEIGGRLK